MRVSPYLLLIGYAVLGILNVPNSVLASDDGNWLRLGREIVEYKNFLFGGTLTSQGWQAGPVVAYFHALFYLISPTIEGILIGGILFNLGTHILLFKIGDQLGSRTLGVVGSLLYFLSPVFFCYFGAKACEHQFLPFFAILTLFFLLKWERKTKVSNVFLVLLPLFFAIGCHYTVLLLLPVVVWILISMKFKSPAEGKVLFVWAVSALAIAGILYYFGLGSDPLNPLLMFFDLVPMDNRFIANIVDKTPYKHTWIQVISLETALFCFYIVWNGIRFKTLSYQEKVLFLWTVIPLIVLVHSTVFFHHYPHNWQLFMFPATFVVLAKSTLDFAKAVNRGKRNQNFVHLGLCLFMIITAAISSFKFNRITAETGGVSMHLASLVVKNQVVDEILAQDGKPFVSVDQKHNLAYFEFYGWYTAFLFRAPPQFVPDKAKGKIFYIYEPRGMGYSEKFFEEAPRMGLTEFKKIGSVIIYSSEKIIDGAGISVF